MKETASQKLQVRFTPTMYEKLKHSAAKKEKPLNTEIKDLLENALTLEERLFELAEHGHYPPVEIQWFEIENLVCALLVNLENGGYKKPEKNISWHELANRATVNFFNDDDENKKEQAAKLLNELNEEQLSLVVDLMKEIIS